MKKCPNCGTGGTTINSNVENKKPAQSSKVTTIKGKNTRKSFKKTKI